MKMSLYAAYITELIYFPIKITQNITIKKLSHCQQKWVYPKETTSLNVQIEYCWSFSLQNVMWLISVSRPMCALGTGVLKLVLHLTQSLILFTESSNMAPHDKELTGDLKRRIVALHEDSQGYKKIANTLKLSGSTVAKIIQRFMRAGSTQNRPRVGRPKKLSALAERHIQMVSLKNLRRSAVSIAAEIEEVEIQPVSPQTIRRTLHQISVNGCHPRRKRLMKTIHKKVCKQFAEDMSTKHMDYWRPWPMVWWDED